MERQLGITAVFAIMIGRNNMCDKPHLRVGDIIEIAEGHCIYATVPLHFLGQKGCFDRSWHSKIKVEGELNYFAGVYIITKTAYDGGSGHQNSPNGHHVFCVLASDSDIEIDFYQCGPFTALIPDIKPVGKVK